MTAAASSAVGAVEAVAQGTDIRLGPRRHRFVLAVLALEANRVVPIDRLVELSWPESPPPTAIHAIQVAISRLRSVLTDAGAARYQVSLLTRASGYSLEVDPMRVDAHRFRALLRQARDSRDDESRIALLGEGLDLWRGPALAGVASIAAYGQLGHGLDEARLLAIEDQIDARLRLGRHRDVLDELTGLVAAHPSRERPVGQLMLALYRSGRAASALDVFSRARQHLASEFGIDPRAELRQLQLAILRDDAALAPPRPSGPVSSGSGAAAPVPVSRAVIPVQHPDASLAAYVADLSTWCCPGPVRARSAIAGRGRPPPGAGTRLDHAGRRLLRAVTKAARLLLGAEAVAVFSVDPDTGELVFEAVCGTGEARLPGTRLPAGTGIVGWAAANAQASLTDGAGQAAPPSRRTVGPASSEPRGVMAMPLVQDDRCIGVLGLLRPRCGTSCGDDIEALGIFTEQATIALELLSARDPAARDSAARDSDGAAHQRTRPHDICRWAPELYAERVRRGSLRKPRAIRNAQGRAGRATGSAPGGSPSPARSQRSPGWRWCSTWPDRTGSTRSG